MCSYLRRLEEMQVQTQAAARAAAQVEVDEQVAKTLEAERAADTESLTGSLMKQRMRTEDERLALQIYVRTNRKPPGSLF